MSRMDQELEGYDPTKTYWIAVVCNYLDGSTSINGESIEGIFETEEEATLRAEQTNDAYPTLEVYVYELRPLKRVWRGDVRISPVPKRFVRKPTGDERYWPHFDPEKATQNAVDVDE